MGGHQDEWERLYDQKKHIFEEERCHHALGIDSLDELQSSLQYMERKYKLDKPDEDTGFFDHLKLTLRSLQPFADAVRRCSHQPPIANLLWGSVHGVIECALQSSDAPGEICSLISELNASMPTLEAYNKLLPSHPALQWPLQGLYDDYMNFCISAVQYVRKRASANFFRSWFSVSSTLGHSLENTKTSIERHKHMLDEAAATQGARSHAQDTVSTVMTFRNYQFTGRDALLEDLYDRFWAHTSIEQASRPSFQPDSASLPSATGEGSVGPTCCVLRGIGGIGKSQCALEYYFRYKMHYDAVFWLPSEQEPELKKAYSLIATKVASMDHKVKNSKSYSNQSPPMEAARRWLEETTHSWLLIFDNVEDINDLEAFLPTSTAIRGSVIITTQRSKTRRVTDNFHEFDLQDLNREEGSALFYKYLGRKPPDDSEEEIARQLSEQVDGLPLALATIGGYICESGSSVEEFLESFKRSSRVWSASAGGQAEQYKGTLETVFELALRKLPEDARHLIRLLAFLHPDRIPEDLFVVEQHDKKIGKEDDPDHPVRKVLFKRADFMEMIRNLRTRQLVKRDTSESDPFLSMHRTLQWSILHSLSKEPDLRWEIFRQALALLQRGVPEASRLQEPEADRWPQFEKYAPQVLSLRYHCLWPEPVVDFPVDFAEVLSNMGTYMWHAGLLDTGTQSLLNAEEILDNKQVNGDSELYGDLHVNLGIIFSFTGISERKESMRRRLEALEIRWKHHEDTPGGERTRIEEMRWYNARTDLAIGYMHEEQFDEAESIFEECLKKYRTWDTEDKIPFEYSKYYKFMSFIRMSSGQKTRAINYAQKGVDLMGMAAGVHSPLYHATRFLLANILYHAGDVEGALALNEDVLKSMRRCCGEFNHFTLESYSTCAALLLMQGDAVKAAEYSALCLERRKRSSWHQEAVARAQYRYSLILRQIDDHEEAEAQYSHAKRVKDYYLDKFPQYLHDDDNELVVYDQMVSFWAGRFTGKARYRGV